MSVPDSGTGAVKEEVMTIHDDRPTTVDGLVPQQYGKTALPPALPATGPGNSFPATAAGTPLSLFAFGFAVGALGLVDTGILGSTTSFFTVVALGTGAVGLLIGGLWDFRGGNLFGGTFGVAYATFLFTTGLILKFFVPAISASGTNAFAHAFGAWLILWAVLTAMLSVAARTVNMPAFVAFVLLAAVLAFLGIASLGGAASWVSDLTKVGGWAALADMVAAWYLGIGVVLNVTAGNDMLPLWPYHPAAAGK
jgi:succinate-acetate transporter protein